MVVVALVLLLLLRVEPALPVAVLLEAVLLPSKPCIPVCKHDFVVGRIAKNIHHRRNAVIFHHDS
jgi:hypothetical protein